nr:hypothetical protein [Tomato fruit blotch virus]
MYKHQCLVFQLIFIICLTMASTLYYVYVSLLALAASLQEDMSQSGIAATLPWAVPGKVTPNNMEDLVADVTRRLGLPNLSPTSTVASPVATPVLVPQPAPVMAPAVPSPSATQVPAAVTPPAASARPAAKPAAPLAAALHRRRRDLSDVMSKVSDFASDAASVVSDAAALRNDSIIATVADGVARALNTDEVIGISPNTDEVIGASSPIVV